LKNEKDKHNGGGERQGAGDSQKFEEKQYEFAREILQKSARKSNRFILQSYVDG